MALVTATRVLQQGGLVILDGLPAIPEIAELFPKTRRWHAEKLRPCGSLAAWRRHQRRREAFCPACQAARRAWDSGRPADSRR